MRALVADAFTPPELVTQLINVTGGLLAIGLFAITMWQLWRFRRPQGPRGIVVKTEALPEHLHGLSALDGTQINAWGWIEKKEDLLRVFVDPYYTGDGDLRLQTFCPYVVEVQLDRKTVSYRTPLLPLVFIAPLTLFLFPLLGHFMLVPRLRRRLELLANPVS